MIDSVSLSNLTSSDATLEAQIDTEGLPTSYEFKMWSSPCSKHGSGCELLIDVPLPAGHCSALSYLRALASTSTARA